MSYSISFHTQTQTAHSNRILAAAKGNQKHKKTVNYLLWNHPSLINLMTNIKIYQSRETAINYQQRGRGTFGNRQ